ncbi:hypothetical protein [Staphylococcus intermedius]|uniref:Uncharacterized protein n=1 Tax=Staphylococcus intermedius NCTC 11048 TaxID=1141106 RepID=A0A380G924_STAIN|nr:hypothetical protein [Staphylococcus intermedius]SUM46783.1 Uncharacterised protein [Staphylococcus intermedius NCTC 11048]
MDFPTTLDGYMSPKDVAKAFLETAEKEQKNQQAQIEKQVKQK